jgi:CrcB protein
MKQIMLVGLGGFIGSIGRYMISKWNTNECFIAIPIGTLAVNILGSFIIGFLAGVPIKSEWMTADMRLLLMVGICGGFTTFSSFTNENMSLIQNGQYILAFSYTLTSIALGIAAVFIGHYLSNYFN